MPGAIARPPSDVRNQLLRRLPAEERTWLLPRLEPVGLALGTTLFAPDALIDGVQFVEAGMVSMVSVLKDGAQIEVGLVGLEGLIGLPLLLGVETSSLKAIVQAQGSALRLPKADLHIALTDLPSLLGLLLRYVDAFHIQVAQTAACNGRHRIEQRLARWLLMAGDRIEDDTFPMTQDFMSYMLGVQRPGVSVALGALERAGLVQRGRGTIQILDRPGLEEASCECYAIVQRRFDKLTKRPAISA